MVNERVFNMAMVNLAYILPCQNQAINEVRTLQTAIINSRVRKTIAPHPDGCYNRRVLQ